MANQTSVPRQQSGDRQLNQAQIHLIQAVTKLQAIPMNSGQILSNQVLATGSNTINTGLNRALIGWFIVRQRAAATIYDLQDTNTNPTQTLILSSSAAVSVDIFVF